VAAFAMRDDAEHWIEEFGNREMKLREMGASTKRVPPKRPRVARSRGKTAKTPARKR